MDEKIVTIWDIIDDKPLCSVRFYKRMIDTSFIDDLHKNGEFETKENDDKLYIAPENSWKALCSEIYFFRPVSSIPTTVLLKINTEYTLYKSQPLYLSGLQLDEWYS